MDLSDSFDILVDAMFGFSFHGSLLSSINGYSLMECIFVDYPCFVHVSFDGW